jgi:hypothetical protein
VWAPGGAPQAGEPVLSFTGEEWVLVIDRVN